MRRRELIAFAWVVAACPDRRVTARPSGRDGGRVQALRCAVLLPRALLREAMCSQISTSAPLLEEIAAALREEPEGTSAARKL